MNENYSEATSFTPIEIQEDRKPERFWRKYIQNPANQNIQIPISVKIENAKRRIKEKGNKRVEQFNRTHKLQQFSIGEEVLLNSNPVGKRVDNIAKKIFRLYDGPYTPVSYTHLDVYKRQG